MSTLGYTHERLARSLVIAATTVLALGSTAFAQQPDFETQATELAMAVGKRALANARRSIALGPFLGVAPGKFVDGGSDVQLSAGLGLYTFKVRILPGPSDIAGVLTNRAKAELKARIAEFARSGKDPTQLDLDRLAKETWADIKAEFLREVHPRMFEKPGLAFRGDVAYSLDSNAWELRVSGSFGLGPVFVTPGATLLLGHNTVFLLPVELSVPLVFGSSVRTRVMELFARVDFAAHGRDVNSDRALFGARFLLDLI